MTVPRYTYSADNAGRFRSVFDEAIRTRKNMLVTTASTGLSVNTLHLKVSDALRWLAQNEAAKYATLKDSTVVRRRPSGVVLVWKQSTAPVNGSPVQPGQWLEDLRAWLVTAKPDEEFKLADVTATPSQKTALANILKAYPESVYDLDGGKLVVIK